MQGEKVLNMQIEIMTTKTQRIIFTMKEVVTRTLPVSALPDRIRTRLTVWHRSQRHRQALRFTGRWWIVVVRQSDPLLNPFAAGFDPSPSLAFAAPSALRAFASSAGSAYEPWWAP